MNELQKTGGWARSVGLGLMAAAFCGNVYISGRGRGLAPVEVWPWCPGPPTPVPGTR